MLRFSDIDLEMPSSGPLTPGIDQVYEYLRARGINKEQIDELGLLIVPASDLIQRARGADNSFRDTRLAVVFPHADAQGRPIDWWSARLVDTGIRQVGGGFKDLVDKKLGKMFCPPNEPPHAYLVPSLDWSKLKHGDKVYIHESCIKAANGARLGYWSVGLNGVRGWSSRKHCIGLVEELRSLPWKALQLQPIIVFDSNAADNWDVQHAIASLGAKLLEVTGQHARHLVLPPNVDGTHWGFDDFAISLGDDAAKRYLDAAAESEPVEVSDFEQLRLQLNNEVCVVRNLGRIAEQETGTLMTRGTFIDVNYAHFVCEGDDKLINVPRVWLTDDRRTEVAGLEYAPGGPSICKEYLNLWRGMGVDPAPGHVAPWLRLLQLQIPDEALRKWVIQWFAYPLQNLGAKISSYIYLFGPPGNGKNAVLHPIMQIYGRNGIVIGKDQIASTFNSVYATRQFVNIDELHGGSEAGAVAITNRVKMITTSPKLTVNKKGEPEYEVDNHVNLAITANYSDAIKLDEQDRRACVIKFGHKLDKEFWAQYFNWAGPYEFPREEAASALYQYLLGVDMTGFDPAAHAPVTEWKEIVTDATRTPMEKWVLDLASDPDSVLPPIMRGFKVLLPEQLGSAYYPDEPSKNTPGLRNALGQRMQDVGFERAIVKVDGVTKRVWIIADRDAVWNAERVRSELKVVKSKY